MSLAADNLNALNPAVAAVNRTELVLLVLDEHSFRPPSVEGKMALAVELRDAALAAAQQPELLETVRLIKQMS